MNKLDKDYQDLLKDIIDNGVVKKDRTGTGTKSVFGRQIRHKMSEGFPLLTTKKMYHRGMFTELLWLLNGDTNIQWLVQNDCNIWVGDAYKKFLKHVQDNWHDGNLDKMVDKGYIIETMVLQEESGNDFDSVSYEPLSKAGFTERIRLDDDFATKWGDLGPIYGKQWRDWNDVDQISNLVNNLIKNPDSRRLMVNAWKVDEINQMTLPPCHYGFQVTTRELSWQERRELLTDPIYVRDFGNISPFTDTIINLYLDECNVPKRAISLLWTQRSCDVPLGIPFNIASYGALLMILGELTNMVPDELIGQLGDCHIYLNQVEGALLQVSREPLPLPKLVISTEFWNPENVLGTNWDAIIEGIEMDDFKIENYKYHDPIKFPLSN